MYDILKIVLSVLFRLIYKINIIGNNKFPENQSYIIASNHISFLDPIIVAVTLQNKPIHFIAKKELFKNKLASKFLLSLHAIPIDRTRMDFRAMKNAFNVLKNKKILGIFPEGTRVKNGQENNTKNGIGMFAIRADAPVIPISIVPHNNYKIFSQVDVIYGKPYIVPEELKEKNSENYENVSNDIMNIIERNKKHR